MEVRLPVTKKRISFLQLANFIGLGILGWLALFEPPFLQYTNLPFPVLNTNRQVHQGEAVRLEVQRCNNAREERTYPLTHAVVRVESGIKTLLPATQVLLSPGCRLDISTINVVPSDLQPGIYYATGVAEVQGTIRTHRIPWRSQNFEVIK